MKTLLILVLLAVSTISHAMPKTVILIRHGEEPKGDEGTELSQVGWARAQGIAKLFETAGITQLIALKPHKKNGSIRSIQTLQPISQELGLEVQTPYTRAEVSSLVDLLANDPQYDDQIVLVAWQHETLADIAHQLGASDAPEEWGKAFDRYWVLEFKNGQVSSFKNLPQRILSGDSNR